MCKDRDQARAEERTHRPVRGAAAHDEHGGRRDHEDESGANGGVGAGDHRRSDVGSDP